VARPDDLPVKDLDESMAFFTAVGFKNNPRFTDKTAACMVVTDEINAMLLTHPKFKDATGEKPIVDDYAGEWRIGRVQGSKRDRAISNRRERLRKAVRLEPSLEQLENRLRGATLGSTTNPAT